MINLLAGGWKLKNMGIPAQCVLLDYCGCKKHWHNEGMTTGINVDKLLTVLGVGDTISMGDKNV